MKAAESSIWPRIGLAIQFTIHVRPRLCRSCRLGRVGEGEGSGGSGRDSECGVWERGPLWGLPRWDGLPGR